jgi:DNA-binding MarR family transcriptional regulator
MNEPLEELPLDPALGFLQCLWELNHSLQRLSRRMERRLGISAPQRLIVRCVGKYPGMTAGQLAAMLHLDPGTVSAALRRLERQNLLRRRRDARDRRRVVLGLTPEGRALDILQVGTVEWAVVQLLDTSAKSEIATTRSVLRRLSASLIDQAAGTERHPDAVAADDAGG